MTKDNEQILEEYCIVESMSATQATMCLNAMSAAREDERERIREIIEKELDLARYSYDESTCEMLTNVLNLIK